MTKTLSIFIDADAFIGIESKDDAHHKKASTLLKSLKELHETNVVLYTSWDVIDEVATKLSYFLGRKQSVSFLKSLDLFQITILYPDKEIYSKTKNIFKKTPKRVSFTDCTNMILVQKYDIDVIFSFDKIYEKQGYQLLNSYALR